MFSFSWIDTLLAIAGAPEPDDTGEPFDIFIDVAGVPSSPRRTVKTVGFAFDDSVPVPEPFLLFNCLELAQAQRRKLKTLVHCQAGQSRSVTVVALYLMAREKINWDQAIQKIKSRRPLASPHPLLTSPMTRAKIVEIIQQFLAGDIHHLEKASQSLTRLQQADRDRGTIEPAHAQDHWVNIDRHFALGSARLSKPAAREAGFSQLIEVAENVAESQKPEPFVSRVYINPDNPTADQWSQALDHVQEGLQNGPLLLFCRDARLLSPALLAGFYTLQYSWDYSSALWYIRQRHRNVMPFLPFLQTTLLEQLHARRQGSP